LAARCRAYGDGVVDRYPVRDKKAAIPEHAMVAGVVHKRGKVLLVRRPDEGFLGGLWEFPGGRCQKKENLPEACRRTVQEQTGLTIATGAPIARVRHAYTHFKITLGAVACRWESGRVRLDGPVAFRWVPLRELEVFPLTGAIKKVLPHLK
jgi:A/G-specific adenine glycosylase